MNLIIKQVSPKPIEVKQTVKNMKLTYKTQLQFAKMEADSESFENDPVKGLEKTLSTIEQVQDYLTTVLHLTAKQQEALEEVAQEELFEIAQYAMMRIMGMTEKDIEEAQGQEDPKD